MIEAGATYDCIEFKYIRSIPIPTRIQRLFKIKLLFGAFGFDVDGEFKAFLVAVAHAGEVVDGCAFAHFLEG